jgi:hypothetical protein
MVAAKPRYYRFTAGPVTRHFYVERYQFQSKEDRETFIAWVNSHDPSAVKEVEVDYGTVSVYWNRG